jgi:alkyl hydroperoxide reductase subunit AhpF
MAMLTGDIKRAVEQFLARMDQPVVARFYPKPGDPASDALNELLDELAAITDRLRIERVSEPPTPVPPETAEDLESSVTIVGRPGELSGIRYLGFPGGHEFGRFLEDIVNLSTNQPPRLSPSARAFLEGLTTPIHLQVFVTPT